MNMEIVRFILFTLGLLVCMLFFITVGWRVALRYHSQECASERTGLGIIEAAIFGLMSLLIGFTLSGALTRFDARRQLIAVEANAIGTAWLRLDLLPAEAQPLVRESFRTYVDSRVAGYRKLPDIKAATEELSRGPGLQVAIWTQVVAACKASGSQPATMLCLPALNQMFDITNTRAMADQTHPPWSIFLMLGALALASSLLAGYRMAGDKARSRLHILGFTFILAITLYVIIDLEFPHLGLIRIDAANQMLERVSQSMK